MSATLYVGNLHERVTVELLRRMLASHDRFVLDVTIPYDQQHGRSRGYAFVVMSHREAARAAAAQLDGRDVYGRLVIAVVLDSDLVL